MAGKQGRETLESLTKDDLVTRAEALGIDGARKFTRVELVDEIIRASGATDRGLLGRARDLLRGVVEKGLTRSSPPPRANGEHASPPSQPEKVDVTPAPPVPTVTLAEIYVAQGHVARARAILREVLRTDAHDAEARALLDQLEREKPSAPEDDPYARVGIEPEAFIEPEAAIPEAVPSMLDDAPFPARYDVDECVAMAVDPTTVYVYWEARRATVQRAQRVLARAGDASARAVLRVLVVEPHERGPRVSTRDFEIVDLELGEWFVRELPPSSIVRAAIGLLQGERFLPLAHTPDVEAPVSAPSRAIASEYVEWTEGETRADVTPRPRLAPIGREAGALGLPPMPEPPEDELGRGLSSAELAKRARVARARAAALASPHLGLGLGASDLLAKSPPD